MSRRGDTGSDDEGEKAAGGQDEEEVEEHEGVGVVGHDRGVEDAKSPIRECVGQTCSIEQCFNNGFYLWSPQPRCSMDAGTTQSPEKKKKI